MYFFWRDLRTERGDENLFGETQKWRGSGQPTTTVPFFVSKNKTQLQIAAFFCNQISSKSFFLLAFPIFH